MKKFLMVLSSLVVVLSQLSAGASIAKAAVPTDLTPTITINKSFIDSNGNPVAGMDYSFVAEYALVDSSAGTTQYSVLNNGNSTSVISGITDDRNGNGPIAMMVSEIDSPYYHIYSVTKGAGDDTGEGYGCLGNASGNEVEYYYDDKGNVSSFIVTVKTGPTKDAVKNVVCDVVNMLEPTVTIEKNVINDDGGSLTPSDFSFVVNNQSLVSGDTSLPIISGEEVSLSEVANPGYSLISIICVDSEDNIIYNSDVAGMFEMPETDVYCLFTNDDNKVVIPPVTPPTPTVLGTSTSMLPVTGRTK